MISRREVIFGLSGAMLIAKHGSAWAAPECLIRPQETEGPYFVDEHLHRSDIRSDPSTGLAKLNGLENDLGNPASWPQSNEVSLLVPPAPGVDPIVRLVPKVHRLVKTLDVTVNMARGHIEKAVWTRYDGGTITMTQKYGTVAAHEIVAEQDASIRIPKMSADVVATYSNFAVDTGGTR